MLPDPGWNDTRRPYPNGQSVHRIVRDNARACPGAVALVQDAASVTYGELDHAADVYAARLAAAGVSRGALVPVLLARSPGLVAVMLAVLKLGAAYALVDADWPERRIREVVDELGARVMVAVAKEAGRSPLPVWSPPPGPLSDLGAEPTSPGFVPADVGGGDPCCVFFTSGTTGRPKGVLTPHRALVRLFRPGTFARFAADTVMPQAAALPWDGFALEVWSVLLNGGTSVLVDEPYLSAQALREGVARHAADTAWLTSSLFNMIVDEDPAAFRGLRQLMIGGERLSPSHVRAFLRQHAGITLINGYGPVESTVFTTTHRVTMTDCDRPDGIPLGRPVPDTQVYVLDGSRPCDVGEPGELCVAGDGLALGYLGSAALTAAKFPELVVDGKITRLYRTGDIAYWDTDGLLHYRGRTDRQVKIRGHRIEPVEVERQIEQLLDVRRCAVVVRGDGQGVSHALLAFCVPRTPGDPLTGAREVLCSGLARHHVPEAVLSIGEFPLTSNGKLDEQALLMLLPANTDEAQAEQVQAEQTAEPPAAEEPEALIRQVADVFAAVLDRTAVPADVSFTALGGTSLQVGRVSARLTAELGRPVPVSRLFRYPTARSLAGWLRQPAEPASTEPASTAAATLPSADVPLHQMQTGFLTRHLLEPEDRSGHCLNTWLINGEPDTAALASALKYVHRRHDALSAAYLLGERGPVARPVDASVPALVILPRAESADHAVSSVRAELSRPLDLTAGQTWRTALSPVAGGRAVFGCVVHHIAFDGWSQSVLADDLAAGYNAHRRGAPVSASATPSLAEVWSISEDKRRDCDLDTQRDQLRSELAGLAPLRYPGRPLPGKPPGPDRFDELVGPVDAVGLDLAARAAGVTRFVVLLACYARALAETTGCGDFGVGVPVAQRADVRLERSLGCHIDMVCIRMRGAALAGDAGAVAATGRLVERAFCAQDLSFGEVVRLVKPARSARTPLFQNIFAYQNNAAVRLTLDGLSAQFLRQPYLGLPTEVQTEVWPLADHGLRLAVNFLPTAVARRFAADLAKRFADLVRTIDASSHDHRGRLMSPAYSGPSATDVTSMSTAAWLAGATSLPGLFRSVAQQQPEATAVVDGDRTFSYAQLDTVSDQLAARLLAAGVQPGDRVGLLLERSAEIPIGVLGAMKAGAAYVPLDPSYPPERLRYMVADAGVQVVVGDQERTGGCGLGGVQVVEPQQASARHWHVPGPTVSESDPAYVIYTSGSTGKPKGCVVSHRNVLALLRAALPLFDVSSVDRWALFHSFSFDVSVWEFWAAMATGATAITVPLHTAQSPADLLAKLSEQRVTVLGQVPSVFRALAIAHAEAGWPGLFLRYLVFAGENVDLDVVSDFLDHYPAAPPTAVNMYGPTETTVYATHRVLTAADFLGQVRSPIGSALPHLSIEIRDGESNPCQDGQAGEMWIAGEGVAVGYLDRPDLTAERFVTRDGPTGPVRYYRTGDLARQHADGSIEFLGRTDQQIKLRGYRIELGEVEAALRGHHLVRDAAVTVLSTPAGAQFLVACVVLNQPAHEKPAGLLREHAAQVLPRYMVPDRYQVVAELPLTGSGKLDRNALKELAAHRGRPGGDPNPRAASAPTSGNRA